MTAIVTEPVQTEPIQAEQVASEPRTLNQIIAEVQATGEPLLVTIEGKPQFVALSVEAYQALQDRAEHWENVAAVQKSLLQSERGQALPAREALEELGRRHGLLR